MKVLMSIKPVFANLIFSGEKKYEFRKIVPQSLFETVVVYSSSPAKQIIGEFTVEKIISGSPAKIWSLCHAFAGISRAQFMEYFKGRDVAYAIEIAKKKKYAAPLDLYESYQCRPPQSFRYVD